MLPLSTAPPLPLCLQWIDCTIKQSMLVKSDQLLELISCASPKVNGQTTTHPAHFEVNWVTCCSTLRSLTRVLTSNLVTTALDKSDEQLAASETRWSWGGDVAQLVGHRTGTPPTQVRFPGSARDFSSRAVSYTHLTLPTKLSV